MRKLVAYFSATGVTDTVARRLAKAAGADLYEIKPVVPYTPADLNWLDEKARSTVEMHDKKIRPEILTGDVRMENYGVVYLGFPIWWYVAPTLMNTFLEAYDFSGKTIVLFATSGGSDFGSTLAELQPSAPGAHFVQGRLLNGSVSDKSLREIAALGTLSH